MFRLGSVWRNARIFARLRTARGNIFPQAAILRARQQAAIAVANHVLGIGRILFLFQVLRQFRGDRYSSISRPTLQSFGDIRAILMDVPRLAHSK